MDEIIPHQPMSVGQLWMGTSMPYIILGYKMCVYTCMHASIHTYVHPYIHTSIRPYVRTYIHYITLHYITLHYITYIQILHSHSHANTDEKGMCPGWPRGVVGCSAACWVVPWATATGISVAVKRDPPHHWWGVGCRRGACDILWQQWHFRIPSGYVKIAIENGHL